MLMVKSGVDFYLIRWALVRMVWVSLGKGMDGSDGNLSG
jgi:hypothetical protein